MKFLLISILLFSSAFVGKAEISTKQSDTNQVKFLNGILAVIDQIIRSIQASLQHLAEQIREWIENEVKNIADAIANAINEFHNFVDKVREEIAKLIDDQIRPCFEGVPEKLEKIGNDTRSGVEICRENGREKFSVIQKEINEYRDTNTKLFEAARDYVASCFNQANIGDAIKCGVDAARNVTDAVNAIRENNKIIHDIYDTKVREIAEETRNCIRQEIAIGREKVNSVFKEVGQCIEDARNSKSTTIETSTTTTTLSSSTEGITTSGNEIDELE